MGDVLPASDAEADEDPDLVALEGLLGPPKRQPGHGAEPTAPGSAHDSASSAPDAKTDAPDASLPDGPVSASDGRDREGSGDTEAGRPASSGAGGAEPTGQAGAAAQDAPGTHAEGTPGTDEEDAPGRDAVDAVGGRAAVDAPGVEAAPDAPEDAIPQPPKPPGTAGAPERAPESAPGGAASDTSWQDRRSAPTESHDAQPAVRARHGSVLEAERLPSRTTLHPMEPAMGLADSMRKDRFVTVPLRPWPRMAAVAVAATAGLLWVLALRASGRGAPWPSWGLSAPGWYFLLALVGVVGYFVVVRTWPERELRLSMAPSQEQQFNQLQAHVVLLRRAMAAGIAGTGLGLLVLGTAFRFYPATFLLAVGSMLLAAGVVVAIGAAARWGPTRHLYVQTLVLQRLEGMGLGRELALDPRTADVILALDKLLGELPESSLRRFLSQPEAQWYLDLIRKLKGGRGAR